MPTLKDYPNKYVRKAIYDRFNGLMVSGNSIPVHDGRIPLTQAPPAFIIIQNQSNIVDKSNKCEYDYRHTVQLNVVTQTPRSGNQNSSLLRDDITAAIYNDFGLFPLDGGLKVLWQDVAALPGINTIEDSYLIFSQLLTVTLYIV